MSQESKRVLSSFTRKLANCRSSVTVKNLLSYFEGGKYGYSVEDGIPTVITNDYAFADDIANLVTHIRAIFKKPRLFLKKENIIQNVSIATKMDVQSIQATCLDDKNWKIDDGEPHPELVHTFAYEDNYAIYENKFVCALVDAVYDVVSKKINQLCWNFDTLGGQIKSHKEIRFNSTEFLQFSAQKGCIPTLVVNDSPEINVVGSLIKSKKRLQSLRGRELYVQCKKAEKFSLKNVRNTNILTFDADYHFCYNFYLNYLYREPVLATPKQMYLNFITVNLFRAITLCGYDLEDKEALVAVSNSIKLRYEEVSFANDLFTITVSPTEDDNLQVKVKANADFNESTFILRVVNKERVRDEHLFSSVNEYARSLNANKDALTMREFLVTDYSPVKEPNAFYVEPCYADVLTRLQDFIRNCTMLAEGSFYIHSRICPVCGSNLVAPDGNDYCCALCESIYHIFGYGSKMYLWLKQLPDVPTSETAPVEKEEVEQPSAYRLRLRVQRDNKEESVEEPAEEIVEDEDAIIEDTEFITFADTEEDVKIDELPMMTEAVEETIEETVEEPVEEIVDETPVEAIEISDEEAAAIVEAQAEAPVEEPVEESVEEVVEETPEVPAEETVEEPVVEVIEPIVEAPVEEAVEPVKARSPMRMRVRLHVNKKDDAPAQEETPETPAPVKDDEAELDVVS